MAGSWAMATRGDQAFHFDERGNAKLAVNVLDQDLFNGRFIDGVILD
jgi:hypothetical protein